MTFLLGERKLKLTDVTVFWELVCCLALSSFPLAGVAACFPWLLFGYLVLVVGKRCYLGFCASHTFPPGKSVIPDQARAKNSSATTTGTRTGTSSVSSKSSSDDSVSEEESGSRSSKQLRNTPKKSVPCEQSRLVPDRAGKASPSAIRTKEGLDHAGVKGRVDAKSPAEAPVPHRERSPDGTRLSAGWKFWHYLPLSMEFPPLFLPSARSFNRFLQLLF